MPDLRAAPVPTYASQFRCVGADCPESCCQHWGVFVDKPTYQKYRAIPSLRRLAAKHIDVDPHCSSPLRYGRIKLQPDGNCPFLTAKHLCTIHKTYGSQFLSEVCSQYPRAVNRFEGRVEKALHLSCMEAARLVLLSPELIPASRTGGYREFLEEAKPERWRDGAYASGALRRLALQLLQEQGYPLWQRLFLLGSIFPRIQQLMDASDSAGVAVAVKEYAGIVVSGSLRSAMEAIPQRLDIQLEMVLRLLQRRFALEQPDTKFAGCVADLLLVVTPSPEAAAQQDALRYAEAYKCFRRFADTHPNFLQNYLVNYVFRTRFPFADTVDMVEPAIEASCSYTLMVVHYAMLRSLLAGAAARYGDDFSANHALQVASTFSKAVEHHPKFLEETKRLVRADGALSIDALAALLRD